MPYPFNTQIPVTPPPDNLHFPSIHPVADQPFAQFLKPFGIDVYGQKKAMETKPQGPTKPTELPKQTLPEIKIKQEPPNLESAGVTLDPRYLAMVSRIAAYYQQRCQAVANFQQQRCQAWANMHRQKCQEMMQASMLVVAWYIRDRINRRRKRSKRSFRRGLSERCSRSKVTKGESVRRWVTQIPEGTMSPNNPIREKLADPEEDNWSMDRESAPDKEAKLYSVADNLIKSQLAKIDVPLMGALSFDESDSESEDEEVEDEEDDDEIEDDEEMYDDEYVEDGVEDYDDDDDDASDIVQRGTGKGSHERTGTTLT